MGKITVETCEIEGLKIITPAVFGDSRGYFMETYSKPDFEEIGLNKLTENTYKQIIRKFFGSYEHSMNNKNIDLSVKDDVVNYMFEKILYDVFSAKKGRYHVCILQEGIEEDNTRYILK